MCEVRRRRGEGAACEVRRRRGEGATVCESGESGVVWVGGEGNWRHLHTTGYSCRRPFQ